MDGRDFTHGYELANADRLHLISVPVYSAIRDYAPERAAPLDPSRRLAGWWKHAKMVQIIRAVIFDMDGVLADSEPLINAAAVAMFQENGLVVQPEDFLPFVGTGEDRYIGGVAEKYAFPLDLPKAKQRTYEIYLDLVPVQLVAFPGVTELVHACRRSRLQVAVASSADHIKVVANLQKIGLPVAFWDAVVTGEQVTHKKPAPDIFLTAAQILGVEPASCVVVEDAVNGIQAAKAAGMRCVAVAQTFPAGRLGEADIVRDTISKVQMTDLAPHDASIS